MATKTTVQHSPLPYRVEVESGGCEQCGAGKQWEIYDRDDVGIGGMTFGVREEAEHLAEMLNDAYEHGQNSHAELLAALKAIDVILDAVTIATENGVELVGPSVRDVLEAGAVIKDAIAKAETR